MLLRGAVKLVGSRRPVGKAEETHCVFPGNWLEVWLTMRPRFTARPLSEIIPIVRPEAQQNPSDPVISESYRGSEHHYLTPRTAWSRLAPTRVSTSIDSRRLL